MRLFFTILLLSPLVTMSQQILTGKVVFEGEGVPGATVRLIEINKGTTTQADGHFRLVEVPDGVYNVEVRSVGFKTLVEKISIPTTQSLSFTMVESALTMDEIVVTGTLQPTYVSRSPVKVDVVTSKHLNNYTPSAAASVIEGISLVNGVQEVVACGVCFTNSISINGLPGPYTAVLMDGSPIYGNLASVYGLNGIPSMIIERFEVIKGPSSTLYGSEAMAGVINIITKNPSHQPLASVDIMGTSHLESFGNLSVAPKAGKSEGFIGINHAYLNSFDDDNGDGFSDNIHLDRVSLFTKWSLDRRSGKQFSLSAKYFYEDRRNGVELFLQDRAYKKLRGNEEIYGESIYTHRAELFGAYVLDCAEDIKIDYSLSTHHQDSYYGTDHYKASQKIVFTNLIWQKGLPSHRLTGGLTSRFQSYDDNTVATRTNGRNHPDNQYIPGIFIQDEWEANNKITLLVGSRLDHYHHHGLIYSPRISAKYEAGIATTVRSNFGTGFRIVNLFTEDHAFVTGQREVVIEEDLRPEESYHGSFNLNHVFALGESHGMIDVDAFYTHFSNKITPNYETEGEIRYSNTNGNAISKGLGINFQQEFVFPLSYSLGVNVQQVRETENGEVRDLEFAPQWSGIFTLNYTLKEKNVNIGYTANYTGAMVLPEVYDLDSMGEPLTSPRPTRSKVFSIHTLHVAKDVKAGFSVYGGIQNIFNYKQPWSPLSGTNDPNSNLGFSDRFDTAYTYAPIHGREFYVGLKWHLLRE